MMLQGVKFCALQAAERFMIVIDPLGPVPQLYWTLPLFCGILDDQGVDYAPVFRSSNTVILTDIFFLVLFPRLATKFGHEPETLRIITRNLAR